MPTVLTLRVKDPAQSMRFYGQVLGFETISALQDRLLHDAATRGRRETLIALGQEALGQGLRHRAALGVTEESDAIAVVVSEETGNISICHRGKIERGFKPGQFEKRLSELLLRESDQADSNANDTLPEPDTTP